jgi:hypothetical protein
MARHDGMERDLGKRLHAERPEASSDLVSSIARRFESRTERSQRGLRLGFAGALTAVALGALAAVGGVSYAATQASHAFSSVKQVVVAKPTVATKQAVGSKHPTSAGKTYGITPLINNVSPRKQKCLHKINILGHGFLGTTDVEFNGVPSPFWFVNSEHKIVARNPCGSGTGPVTVTTDGGTATSPYPFEETGNSFPENGNGVPEKQHPKK